MSGGSTNIQGSVVSAALCEDVCGSSSASLKDSLDHALDLCNCSGNYQLTSCGKLLIQYPKTFGWFQERVLGAKSKDGREFHL